MSIRDNARKLTSLLGRRAAERAIREEIRQNPEKAVEEALQTIKELRTAKPVAAGKLGQILAEEAGNPAVAAALAKKALKGDEDAVNALEAGGHPIRDFIKLYRRASELVRGSPPLVRQVLNTALSHAVNQAMNGRLSEAVAALKSLLALGPELSDAAAEVQRGAREPRNTVLIGVWRTLISEAGKAVASRGLAAAPKLREVAKRLATLHSIDAELSKIKEVIAQATSQCPALKEAADRLLTEAERAAERASSPRDLQWVKEKALQLRTLARRVKEVRRVLGEEAAQAVLKEAARNPRKALEEAGHAAELREALAEAEKLKKRLPQRTRQALDSAVKRALNNAAGGQIARAAKELKEITDLAKEFAALAEPPRNEELLSKHREALEQAEKAIASADSYTATKTISKLRKIRGTDRELTKIKNKLRKAAETEPLLAKTAQEIIEQAVAQATKNLDPQALKTQEKQAEELEELAERIAKIRKEIGERAAKEIAEEAQKGNIGKALKQVEIAIQYAETIKQTGLTPKELTQYLQHITKNYPPQITNKTIQILKNPPKNTQTLVQEIKNKKPPYKTWAQQKHTNPKQTLIKAIKTTTKTVYSKLWESPNLGNWVKSVAWSPQGDKIAAGGDFRKVIVFSSSDGSIIWESPNLGGYVESVAWSPQGDKIAAGVRWYDSSAQIHRGKVIVFSSSGQKLWESPNLGNWVKSVAWSPQGDKIAAGTGASHKVIVFSSSGKKLWESPNLGGYVESVAWSPQGDKIAAGTGWHSSDGYHGKVIVFSSSDGSIIWESPNLGNWVKSVAWSPQGDKIAAGGYFRKVIVFSSSGKKLWESPDLGNWVYSVAWSPQGDKIAAGGDFRKVIVFSSSGKKLWESPDLGNWVRSVAWSPQGDKIAAGGDFRKVIVFGFGLCGGVWGVLRSGRGVSLVSGGSGLCGGLGGWVKGDCSVSLGGFFGDVIEYLCGSDYFGAAAAYLFGVEAGLEDPGFYDVWAALTMGWGPELLIISKEVDGLGARLGIKGLGEAVLDWFAGELLRGGSALDVAGRVRAVLGRVVGLLDRVKGLVSDSSFVGFVRGSYSGGGLEEFLEVLETGVRVRESPGEVLVLRPEVVGDFVAGSFRRGSLRVCNGSPAPVVIVSASVSGEGVRGDVVGLPLRLGRGECGELGLSLLSEVPGDVPVTVEFSAEFPGGFSTRSAHKVFARVSPGNGTVSVSSTVHASRSRDTAPRPVVERAPPLPPPQAYGGPHFLVGKVLSLGFSPPRPEPLGVRGVVVGGLELRAVVGIGGFAVTLLGIDEVGRSFAVKVPRDAYDSIVHGLTYAPSKKGLRVFEREFEVLRGLKHPHLVRVVAGGVDAGIPYLVMEFCGNGSLRGVLESNGPLELVDALLIGVQVADALAYLHARGVVHRDLKPENILFTDEGLLKVTDFNIAKVMRAVSTTSSKAAYTPGYAAPEQVMWGLGRTGPWTDVWSLGTILYEAITGEPPFEPWEYEDSIKEGPDLEPIPEEVRPVIKKMLVIDPRKRPQATEVRDELAKILVSMSKERTD